MLVTLLMTAVPRLLTSLTNRFNVINISLLAIGIHIGLCSSVIRPWASALISIQRRFTIRGSVGQTIEAFDILLGISSILSRHCSAHLPIQNMTSWNWTHQKIDICFEPGLICVIL